MPLTARCTSINLSKLNRNIIKQTSLWHFSLLSGKAFVSGTKGPKFDASAAATRECAYWIYVQFTTLCSSCPLYLSRCRSNVFPFRSIRRTRNGNRSTKMGLVGCEKARTLTEEKTHIYGFPSNELIPNNMEFFVGNMACSFAPPESCLRSINRTLLQRKKVKLRRADNLEDFNSAKSNTCKSRLCDSDPPQKKAEE